MGLRDGFTLRWHQLKLLCWKNWVFSKRNFKSTALQLLSPLFFTALILALKQIPPVTQDIDHPESTTLGLIPRCIPWNGQPCITLRYAPALPGVASPATLSCMDALVRSAVAQSGLDFAHDVVQHDDLLSIVSFIDLFPNQTEIALVFGSPLSPESSWCSTNASLPSLEYIIFYNGSRTPIIEALAGIFPLCPDGRNELQRLIDQEFIRLTSNQSGAVLDASFRDLPTIRPNKKSEASRESSFDTIFFYCGIMIGWVMLLYNLTVEKDQKLRQGLRIVGLKDSVYWFSWFIAAGVLNTLGVGILIATGYASQLIFFTNTDFPVTLTLLLLYSITMVTFAFFMSNFVSTTRQAVNAGMLLFVVGLLFVALVGNSFTMDALYDSHKTPALLHQLFSLYPPYNLAKAMADIGQAASETTTTGLTKTPTRFTWSNLYDTNVIEGYDNGEIYYVDAPATVMSYYILIGNAAAFCFLAWYLDNVKQSNHGLPRKFYFFLQPSYWGFGTDSLDTASFNALSATSTSLPASSAPSASSAEKKAPIASASGSGETEAALAPAPSGGLTLGDADLDVQVEKKQCLTRQELAFRVCALSKEFSDSSVFARLNCCKDVSCSCCKPSKRSPKQAATNKAVDNVTFFAEDSTLLCLLGHNGAGKSTTINMLTGLLEPNSGDAFIYGRSVVRELDSIRDAVGVCPQHDILWEELTAREHIIMFALLRKVPRQQIEDIVRERLSEVKLLHVADVKVGTFSGGMKRRLSVTLAFVGNPKVVFLDEPSSGLDISVRRELWNMILKKKQGRVIIMTTHAMEEAEALADKIVIMSKGKLQCAGTPVRLKNRFAGYRIHLVAAPGSEDSVRQLMKSQMPSATMVSSTGDLTLDESGQRVEGGTLLLYALRPSATDEIVPFFSLIEKGEYKKWFADFSVSQTTLEEVFLKVTAASEAASHADDEEED